MIFFRYSIKSALLILLCTQFSGAQMFRSANNSELKTQGRAIFLALTEEYKKLDVVSDQWENRILVSQPGSSAQQIHKLGRAEFRSSYLRTPARQQLFLKANQLQEECFRRLGKAAPREPWFSVDRADSLGQRASQLNDLLIQIK